ncbi:tRNA (cytosine(72)-C(5))-methyltransferase NSUN6-like [Liolophura sinensis]|uniref:tRNA (cytosine(72)-C(5))-methyltransferase NSUN6-like n=1 Tax=Liolophura sinensis TaxID=3198878 RepID=UPI0031584FF5
MVQNRGPVEGLHHHDKEIVVDLFCGMAVLRGADVFAQGIMGCHPGVRRGDEVSVYTDVDGACLKGLSKIYSGHKAFVGNGLARLGRDELFCNGGTNLSGIGIEMTKPLYQAPCLADTLLDRVFAQNLPSIVCGHVLDPKPGELILDMCAAPGGKTSHIACLMKNEGRVVALDKSPQKVQKIYQNCQRWGLSCVEGYVWDASKALCEDADAGGGPPFTACSFDRVLVDAPCSALGQRPSFRNKMTAKELKSYPKYQRKLLAVGVELVKAGGVLVYSTCSLPIEENEGQVEWVLKSYPDLQLEQQTPYVGQPGLEGTKLSREQLQLLQRFDPGASVKTHSDWNTDTIGFFLAKFRRKR